MSLQATQNAFLLVEGRDDQEIIWQLRDMHKLPRNFAVKTPKEILVKADGIDALLFAFRQYLKSGQTKTIGIVLDHDNENSWQRVLEPIQQMDLPYTIPSLPVSDGTILQSSIENVPRVGIWLMPDNQQLGDLEVFIRKMIPKQDVLVPFVDDVLNKIESENLHRYRQKRHKAFIHTWLAWQEEPGAKMRRSLQTKALSAQSPIAQQFVAWLNRLFNP